MTTNTIPDPDKNPKGQVTRTVVFKMTGDPQANGRIQRLEIPAGREWVEAAVTGVKVRFVATGSVEWDGDVPAEVWVPQHRYGDWQLLEGDGK